MPCYKKLLNASLRSAVVILLLTSAARAEGITVSKVEVRLGEAGYHLAASYDIRLTQVMKQALSRGMPLYFVSEFSLVRQRWYWLDQEIFHGEQATKLSYNVLTRQYRISRGALFQSFSSLEDALQILSRQSSTAISAELLKKEEGYIADWAEWVKQGGNFVAAARLRLDNAQLPKLLQVNTLSGNDWILDSDWHQWEINPAEITMNDTVKPE